MDESAETIISQNRNEFLIQKQISCKVAKKLPDILLGIPPVFLQDHILRWPKRVFPIDWVDWVLSKMLLCVSRNTMTPDSMETLESIADAGIKRLAGGLDKS
jgi:hypothetical protein